MATVRLLPISVTYSTIAAAYAAADATNNIIQLETDVTGESLTVSKNIAEIRADGSRTRTWDAGGGGPVLTIATGLNRQLKVKDLIIDHSSLSGECVKITGLSASGKVVLENNKFVRTSAQTGDCVAISYTFTQADSLVMDKCLITGYFRIDYGLINNNAQSVDGCVRVQNCVFYNMNQGANRGINFTVACTNTPLYLYNNTFAYLINSSIAVNLNNTRVIAKNNVFAQNTDDVAIAGTSTDADFTYNAFQQQGSPFGSNNIFGIVTATEFVDATTGDFHLNSGAQCQDSGTTIAAVVDDYDYTSRPQGVAYDIGAFELIQTAIVGVPNSLMKMGIGR